LKPDYPLIERQLSALRSLPGLAMPPRVKKWRVDRTLDFTCKG